MLSQTPGLGLVLGKVAVRKLPPVEEDPRKLAHKWRRAGRRLQHSRRVAKCGQSSSGLVLVRAAGEKGTIHGSHLCGSWHSCPVCSRLLATRRARQLKHHAGAWRGGGGITHLLTLTIRHRRSQSLRVLLDVLRRSWDAFASGRQWKEARESLAVAGHCRAVEVRYSRKNGWHPHLHVLLFGSASIASEEVRQQLLEEWGRRWQFAVASVNWRCTPRIGIGLDLREGKAAEYVAKLGWELAGGLGKHGHNFGSLGPWNLLEGAIAKDPELTALWQEYAEQMHGARQLTWSRKIRAPEIEESDAEAVNAEAARGTAVAALTARTYRAVEYAGLTVYLADLFATRPLDAVQWLLEAKLDPPRDPRQWEELQRNRGPSPLPLRRWGVETWPDVVNLYQRAGVRLVELWASSRHSNERERWSELERALARHRRHSNGERITLEDSQTLKQLRAKVIEEDAAWATRRHLRIASGAAGAEDLMVTKTTRRKCAAASVLVRCADRPHSKRAANRCA